MILLSDDTMAAQINMDAIDRFFADADTEINSYIASRYAVPVDPVPALLERLSLDLAIEGSTAAGPMWRPRRQ